MDSANSLNLSLRSSHPLAIFFRVSDPLSGASSTPSTVPITIPEKNLLMLFIFFLNNYYILSKMLPVYFKPFTGLKGFYFVRIGQVSPLIYKIHTVKLVR